MAIKIIADKSLVEFSVSRLPAWKIEDHGAFSILNDIASGKEIVIKKFGNDPLTLQANDEIRFQITEKTQVTKTTTTNVFYYIVEEYDDMCFLLTKKIN